MCEGNPWIVFDEGKVDRRMIVRLSQSVYPLAALLTTAALLSA